MIRIGHTAFHELSLSNADNEELIQKRQMQYYMAAKLSSKRTAAVASGNTDQLGLVTTLAVFRNGIRQDYDSGMPDEEINRLINIGRGRSPSDTTANEDDEMIDIPKFMSNRVSWNAVTLPPPPALGCIQTNWASF